MVLDGTFYQSYEKMGVTLVMFHKNVTFLWNVAKKPPFFHTFFPIPGKPNIRFI